MSDYLGKSVYLSCGVAVIALGCSCTYVRIMAKKKEPECLPVQRPKKKFENAIKLLKEALKEGGFKLVLWGISVPAVEVGTFLFQTKSYRLMGNMGKYLAEKNSEALAATTKEFLLIAVPLSIFGAMTTFTHARLAASLRAAIHRATMKRLKTRQQVASFGDVENSAAVMNETVEISQTLMEAWQKSINGSVMFFVNVGYMCNLVGFMPLMRIFGISAVSSMAVRGFSRPLAKLRASCAADDAVAATEAHRLEQYAEEMALLGADSTRYNEAVNRAASRRNKMDFAQLLMDATNSYATRQVGTAVSVMQMIPLASRTSEPLAELTVAIHLLINAGKGLFSCIGGYRQFALVEGSSERWGSLIESLDSCDADVEPGPLIFSNATLNYGSRKVWQNLSWSAAPNERWAIRGENGVGKTSLFRAIAGIVRPMEGTCDAPAFSECVFLPQRPVILEGCTLRDNLLFTNRPQQESRLEEVLVRVGLGLDLDKICTGLSGGEQQRVALARMLLRLREEQVNYLFMDEPTASLSASCVESIMKNIHVDADGKTVVTITHNDKVASLYQHQLTLEGSTPVISHCH